MEKQLNLIIEQMKTAFGDSLKTVMLYGSKASAEGAGNHSDYNVLIILNEVTFESQKKLVAIMAGWIKSGNPPPLLFGEEMFRDSADVFPIEFFDMRDNNKLLYGQDPLGGLKIANSNLRHQCEFELKGKLLKLRQGYLLSQSKKDRMRDLMTGSVSSILVVLRHTLRLSGNEPPAGKIQAIEMFGKLANISPDVFITISRIKNGELSASGQDIENLMSEYLSQLDKAVSYIDGLN